jgi:hypothetical protein
VPLKGRERERIMHANGQRSGGAWITGVRGMLQREADQALEVIAEQNFGGDVYV